MKKLFFFLILTLMANVAFSQAETINVCSHEKVTIFTNPKEGTNSFTSWCVFPAETEEIRRITMHVTLAYPKDRAIAHWDYLDRINLLRQGGLEGRQLDFEIGRMLTPYGSSFKEDWEFTWSVDVTDFEAFLRDSVEIEYVHTGYEPQDLGWDLTINFEIESGPSIAKFISVEKLWEGSFQYGNPENDIENSLAVKEITKSEGSSFGRLRIQHTGHGMDDSTGCSEFCSRWRRVIFDGVIIDHRDIWKVCGDSPLYPQGGTWIFDRGNWCPGDLQTPDMIDVPLTKLKHTIDLEMEPFVAKNVDQPKEVIASYFFQFGEPEHSNDVAIEEIIVPNKSVDYSRRNPSGFEPRIKIRNLGKENLKTLDVRYKTVGFKEKKFKWKGDLEFYKEAYITLPGEISAKEDINTFSVMLSKPNGKKDEWKADNYLESEFVNIPTIPSKFVMEFLTNNEPEENWISIVNSSNDTVYYKSQHDLEPVTNYTDTLELSEGSYALNLVDIDGDGLEFWLFPESGYGRLLLKDIKGNLIHLFESDCGNGQYYSFRCDDEAVVDTTKAYFMATIYPRRVSDDLTIYTLNDKHSKLKVIITKDGEFIEQHEYANVKDATIGLNARHLEKGRYVMEIYLDDEHKMNRRFNKK